MENPEKFNSQESLKDRLIQSGIAQEALDIVYPGKGMGTDQFEIKVAMESESPLNGKTPVIIFEFKKTGEKVFISENNHPQLSKNLNNEQKQLLAELSENADDVWDEYDDKTKKSIVKRLEKEVIELSKNQK
jgi:hypothetical protein